MSKMHTVEVRCDHCDDDVNADDEAPEWAKEMDSHINCPQLRR